MAIKREREWYWRDSLGNTEQHLQTGAEVDYLKPEDGTPLSGVTTPAGTFRCAKKKKKPTPKQNKKNTIFSLMGKRLSFLQARHSVEQTRCIQQDRIPSSPDLTYCPQWDTPVSHHTHRQRRCTDMGSLEEQFPHSSSHLDSMWQHKRFLDLSSPFPGGCWSLIPHRWPGV